MRHEASKRANANAQKCLEEQYSIESDLKSAKAAEKDALSAATESEMNAEMRAGIAAKTSDLTKFKKQLSRKQIEMKIGERTYSKRLSQRDVAVSAQREASVALNSNADLYYRAKVDASNQKNKRNVEVRLKADAILAYTRFRDLFKASLNAKEEAELTSALAAEKECSVRYARDFRTKKSRVKGISPELAKMSLLSGTKYKYWDNSLRLPFFCSHSISEGKMKQLLSNDDMGENEKWREFNKHHMIRVYPSRQKSLRQSSNNYNPVMAWSLGCQVASLNQQVCDAFVLVNDGRFRVNGSCGYVLKPESMIERKGGDISRRNRFVADMPQVWSIKILSGQNFPQPRKKILRGNINPRVRVTLYDGGLSPPIVHLTESVKMNGLSPIWAETKGAKFHVKDPSTAILLFSLWDWETNQSEDFIAAASIPVSCMRQGYRSVPLFDSNHMRCGSYAFASLLVQVTAVDN